MKRLWHLWPALLCIATFSFSATLWFAADLGTMDAQKQWARLMASQCLSVYPRHENGMPNIDDTFVKKYEVRTEVRCIIPVAELPATIAGVGYSMDVVLRAVPESKLALTGRTLSLGKLPHSAWQPEALLGSKTAEKLTLAANTAGQAMPSRIKLYIAGQEACTAGKVSAEEVYIAGVATPTASGADNTICMDDKTLQSLVNKNKDFYSNSGITLAPIRADIYMNDVLQMDAFARQLVEQGFLVVNPIEKQAQTLHDGQIMTRQWAVITMLSGIAALLAAWRCFRSGGIKAVLAAAAACAVGIIAAIALMQPAMLLGWRFIISGNARYLLNLPRVIAIFAGCTAIALFTVHPSK